MWVIWVFWEIILLLFDYLGFSPNELVRQWGQKRVVSVFPMT